MTALKILPDQLPISYITLFEYSTVSVHKKRLRCLRWKGDMSSPKKNIDKAVHLVSLSQKWNIIRSERDIAVVYLARDVLPVEGFSPKIRRGVRHFYSYPISEEEIPSPFVELKPKIHTMTTSLCWFNNISSLIWPMDIPYDMNFCHNPLATFYEDDMLSSILGLSKYFLQSICDYSSEVSNFPHISLCCVKIFI